MKIENTIRDYKEWIGKEIPISSDWIEEINYISYLRQEIHEQKEQLTNEQVNEVRELDRKLQSWAAGNTAKNFKYTDKPEDYTDSQMWWWRLDKLNNISSEGKNIL